MSKKILKFAALVLAFAIMTTSCVVAATTQNKSYIGKLNIKDLLNPVYHSEEETVDTYSLKAEKYYAYYVGEEPFDKTLCVTDNDAIGEDIREVMVDRGSNLTVYFKSSVQQTSNSLYEYLVDWSEIAFEETENSYEGDYLRYVYDGISSSTITVIYDERWYYYQIPLFFEYYTTKAQEDALTEKIDEVIDDFGFTNASTDRQKSDKIYDYITENVTYDYTNLDDESYKLKFTAYAAMMDGTAVCQGYATLYYRMARECGLNVRVITGKSFGENHAWNIVELYGKFYYLDSTWDAGETEYDYYLLGSTNFTTDHTPEAKYYEEEFTQKYPVSDTDLSIVEGDIGDFEYKINNGTAIITKYKGTDENVTVPSYIAGYSVSSIGEGAFSANATVKTITISEGITTMEMNAISSCANLRQINFPASMYISHEKHGDTAFSGFTAVPTYCPNLEVVTVASGNAKMKVVDGILYSADGKNLIFCSKKINKTKVIIPYGVVTIAPRAFDSCESIEEVVMPDTVKHIGYWSFSGAINLQKINISESCEFIGQFAFHSTAITQIYIPSSVEKILGAAFGDCPLKTITTDNGGAFYMENGALRNSNTIIKVVTDATEYTVVDGITDIEQYAFSNLSGLKSVTLPDSLRYLAPYAFSNCESMTHLEIPDGTERVEDNIILGCDLVASIIIPKSVTTIGEDLLKTNNGLTIYCDEDSIAYEYAVANGFPTKRISEFVCGDGHNLTRVYENDIEYRMTCTKCGDKGSLIRPFSIYNTDVELEYFNTEYTGKEIEPEIKSVKFNGEELIEGADYIIKDYKDNVEIGTAYVVIEGINEWGGIKEIPFMITEVHVENVKFKLEYETTRYDGTDKKPKVTAAGLTEGVDFEVNYQSNVIPGEATVVVSGKGKYWGQTKLYFTIERCDISNMECVLERYEFEYTGFEQSVGVEVGDLYYYSDYTVSYENNINVGTATVIVTGVNNYTGTIRKTFQIVPADINNYYISLEYTTIGYDGAAKKPDVKIYRDGLVLNTDYTVEYSNNVNIGTATVTIKGIGNYKGTVSKNFAIMQAYLENFADNIELEYTSIEYSGKSNKPEVTVSGLVEGVDYTVTYGENINVGNGWVQLDGIGNYSGSISKLFLINSLDINKLDVELEYYTVTYSGNSNLPNVIIDGLVEYQDYQVQYIGDNIGVGTVTVQISGMGNYSGTVVKEFTITPRNIADYEIIVDDSPMSYNGYEWRPTVYIPNLTIDQDYTVQYSNNIEVGTATIKIIGKGGYTGTVIKTFEITRRDISEFADMVYLPYSSITYSGNENKPSVSVPTCTAGVDYEIVYLNNVNIGTAEIRINGIGNCQGTIIKYFDITPIDIGGYTLNIASNVNKYTGSEIRPEVNIYGLTEGKDYKLSYEYNINVGSAIVTVTGIGNCVGTLIGYFDIVPRDISELDINLEYNETIYDGYEKCPIITINGLTESQDFQVTYENNVNPGVARAIITAWGNYEGTVYVEFNIVSCKDGLVEESGVMYYYENGMKSTKTGLVDYEGKKMYINKGRFTGASGLVTINGKKTYINKGYFTGSSGLVTINGKKAYINKGYFTGASGLVTIGGKKMYINKGYFTGSSGLVTVGGKKMYINKGYFTGSSGLVTVGGKKLYINKGYFLGSTGLVTISGKKAYINKGYFTGATGIVKIGGKKYYIKKGYAQLSFSGKVKIGGKTYKVVKGIVK